MIDEAWTGPPHDPRRYRVDLVGGRPVAEPGGGGDGLVYRARTTHRRAQEPAADDSERTVALKLLLHARTSDLATSSARVERLAGIDHPSLMRPIEVFAGTALTTTDGLPDPDHDICWLAAEWVDGHHLDVVAPQLTCAGRLRLVSQIARAVAVLHDAGATTHEDVKPSNIRVTPDGRAVLIDYGALDPVGTAPDPTRVDRRTGTAGWLAPEVAAGLPAGAAADVWGIGAVAHHLVVGSPPRLDGAECARERLVYLGGRAGLDRVGDVATHLARLLETDPGRRPTDLHRWADRLDRLLERRRTVERSALALTASVLAAFVLAAFVLATAVMVTTRDGAPTTAGGPTTSRPGAAAVDRTRSTPPRFERTSATTGARCERELDGTVAAELARAVAALDDACAAGTVERHVEAEVVPLERDGAPAGVLIAGPGLEPVRLTAAEWSSYREIAGRSQPENSVTFGGYPTQRRVRSEIEAVVVELSSGGLLAGRRADTQLFWIPRQARALWESTGGFAGRLGFPTSNVFLSGGELRLEFEGGYLAAVLDPSPADDSMWIPFSAEGVDLVEVDEPGAALGGLGDLSGRVLRQAGGTTWFVDDDLVRHWIPDGPTWECLGAEERRVGGDIPGYAVASLELGPAATCDLVR